MNAYEVKKDKKIAVGRSDETRPPVSVNMGGRYCKP